MKHELISWGPFGIITKAQGKIFHSLTSVKKLPARFSEFDNRIQNLDDDKEQGSIASYTAQP
jgi:hypothetical protein